MTREEAIEILRHYDDSVWQQENKVTMGMVADAIRMGEDALQSPWKSVNEELPKCDINEEWGEKSRKMIFVDEEGVYHIGEYCTGLDDDNRKDCFWWAYFEENQVINNVTHWMPIPELTKEDTK